MMNKSKCVPEGSYEKYGFPIPLIKLFGQKRRSYICSELIKRHPCFSEDFCYDSRISFGKKGFYADVVVIDRLSFLHFQKNSLFPMLFGLSFQNLKGKRFASKKIKLISGIVLMALILLFFCWHYSCAQKTRVETINTLEEEALFTEKIELMEMGQSLCDLLLLLKENSAVVKSLNWSCDGMNELVSFETSSVYPESLLGKVDSRAVCELSSVLYHNGVPELSISVKNKVNNYSLYNLNYDDDFKALLRSELIKMKCRIIEERAKSCAVRFEVRENIRELFLSIGELAEGSGVLPILLKINKSNEEVFFVEIEFMKGEKRLKQRNVLTDIAESELFYIENKKQKETRQIILPVSQEIQNKVGEVRLNNGEKRIYYKDAAGKMRSKIIKG